MTWLSGGSGSLVIDLATTGHFATAQRAAAIYFRFSIGTNGRSP